ncbi:hypothetical protein EDC01DRAFT_759987 [Geopyxis carbonaria]|nr:hypothetical protein EDC01DRAFT_759987 [Geopyxis carbonaria]
MDEDQADYESSTSLTPPPESPPDNTDLMIELFGSDDEEPMGGPSPPDMDVDENKEADPGLSEVDQTFVKELYELYAAPSAPAGALAFLYIADMEGIVGSYIARRQGKEWVAKTKEEYPNKERFEKKARPFVVDHLDPTWLVDLTRLTTEDSLLRGLVREALTKRTKPTGQRGMVRSRQMPDHPVLLRLFDRLTFKNMYVLREGANKSSELYRELTKMLLMQRPAESGYGSKNAQGQQLREFLKAVMADLDGVTVEYVSRICGLGQLQSLAKQALQGKLKPLLGAEPLLPHSCTDAIQALEKIATDLNPNAARLLYQTANVDSPFYRALIRFNPLRSVKARELGPEADENLTYELRMLIMELDQEECEAYCDAVWPMGDLGVPGLAHAEFSEYVKNCQKLGEGQTPKSTPAPAPAPIFGESMEVEPTQSPKKTEIGGTNLLALRAPPLPPIFQGGLDVEPTEAQQPGTQVSQPVQTTGFGFGVMPPVTEQSDNMQLQQNEPGLEPEGMDIAEDKPLPELQSEAMDFEHEDSNTRGKKAGKKSARQKTAEAAEERQKADEQRKVAELTVQQAASFQAEMAKLQQAGPQIKVEQNEPGPEPEVMDISEDKPEIPEPEPEAMDVEEEDLVTPDMQAAQETARLQAEFEERQRAEAQQGEERAAAEAMAVENARLKKAADDKAEAEEAARLKKEEEDKAAADEAARLQREADDMAAAEEAARLKQEEDEKEAARLKKEADDKAAADEAARIKQEADEAARLKLEQDDQTAAQEAARLKLEQDDKAAAKEAARLKKEIEVAKRKKEREAESQRVAEAEAKKKAQELNDQREAESKRQLAREARAEEARLKALERDRIQAQEDDRLEAQAAKADAARRKEEEDFRLQKEARAKAKEADRVQAEANKLAKEEAVRPKVEEAARLQAQEAARLQEEAATRQKAEEAARLQAEKAAILQAATEPAKDDMPVEKIEDDLQIEAEAQDEMRLAAVEAEVQIFRDAEREELKRLQDKIDEAELHRLEVEEIERMQREAEEAQKRSDEEEARQRAFIAERRAIAERKRQANAAAREARMARDEAQRVHEEAERERARELIEAKKKEREERKAEQALNRQMERDVVKAQVLRENARATEADIDRAMRRQETKRSYDLMEARQRKRAGRDAGANSTRPTPRYPATSGGSSRVSSDSE